MHWRKREGEKGEGGGRQSYVKDPPTNASLRSRVGLPHAENCGEEN